MVLKTEFRASLACWAGALPRDKPSPVTNFILNDKFHLSKLAIMGCRGDTDLYFYPWGHVTEQAHWKYLFLLILNVEGKPCNQEPIPETQPVLWLTDRKHWRAHFSVLVSWGTPGVLLPSPGKSLGQASSTD